MRVTSSEAKKLGWNQDAGLRKPFNPKRFEVKEIPDLLVPQFGQDKPYLGREKQLQRVTADYLARFDQFKYLAFHVPNEREKEATRVQLSFQGVKPGVSDWIILIPFEINTKKYVNCVIELKAFGGTVSQEQVQFLNTAQENACYACVCWNFEVFKEVIDWAYFNNISN